MVIVFDLDDTLYNEIDFVKSGFLEVSKYLHNNKYFDFMWEEFLIKGSGKIFDCLIKRFHLQVNLQKLIEIYRFHFPSINLSSNTVHVLNNIKNKHKIALLSDGHYITQQNKFKALKLKDFVDLSIFTDYYHTQKPETKAFKILMSKLKDKKYIYIADNPKKDFLAPKKLGWTTIRYKNPQGIYRDIPNDNADYEISEIKEILYILNKLL